MVQDIELARKHRKGIIVSQVSQLRATIFLGVALMLAGCGNSAPKGSQVPLHDVLEPVQAPAVKPTPAPGSGLSATPVPAPIVTPSPKPVATPIPTPKPIIPPGSFIKQKKPDEKAKEDKKH